MLFLYFDFLQTLCVFTSNENQGKVSEKRVSQCVDVRKIFLPKKQECSCKDWRKGVQQLHDGLAKIFKNYPDITNAIGENMLTSFKIYTNKLTSWTMCNSTILSTRSISILQAMTLLSTAGKSASYLVNENSKATPSLVTAYTKIVYELSDNIGELTDPISDVIVDLGKLFEKISKQFQDRFVERKGSDEKIDFKAMMKCAQLLANTIGLIAETALDDCGFVTIPNDTYDAIAILIFILNDCFLSVQGIIVSMASVLHSESSGISDFLHSCLVSLDPFIKSVGQSITSLTMDTDQCVRVLLTEVVNLLYPLNKALDNLLEPSDGANITVAQIRRNLLKA